MQRIKGFTIEATFVCIAGWELWSTKTVRYLISQEEYDNFEAEKIIKQIKADAPYGHYLGKVTLNDIYVQRLLGKCPVLYENM